MRKNRAVLAFTLAGVLPARNALGSERLTGPVLGGGARIAGSTVTLWCAGACWSFSPRVWTESLNERSRLGGPAAQFRFGLEDPAMLASLSRMSLWAASAHRAGEPFGPYGRLLASPGCRAGPRIPMVSESNCPPPRMATMRVTGSSRASSSRTLVTGSALGRER